MFLQGLDHLYQKIKSGILDQMLVKPRTILFQVICSDFMPTKIARLLESLILIIIGLINSHIVWTLYKIIVFMLVILGSLLLFASLLIVKAALSFWTVDGMELMNILLEGGRDLSTYPISIYNDKFAKFFTYVIPFGMVNYFPLVYLFEKQVDTPFWYGLTPLVAIIFLGLTLLLWRKGITAYKSTGS